MKSNKGLIGTIILFLLAAGALGIFLYVKSPSYDPAKMKFFSIFDKKIKLDFPVKTPAPTVALPKVEAGDDILVKYPKTSVTLKGSATSSDGGPLIYAWYKLSGGIATLVTPFSDTTVVKGLKKGKYLFRLIATDSKGVKSADEVTITMEGGPTVIAKASKKTPKSSTTQTTVPTENPEVNLPPSPDPELPQNMLPLSEAGRDQEVTMPVSSITLSGNGSDTDGYIASYSWVQLEGNTATIVSPSEATTTITDLSAGSYRFELIVTDNQGSSDSDTVGIAVNPEPQHENILPSADAGSDQEVVLPDITATLNGSGSDADGIVVSYQWTQIEGGYTTITSPTSPTTTITELTMGTYVYQLIVTDDEGATASSTVVVNVVEQE